MKHRLPLLCSLLAVAFPLGTATASSPLSAPHAGTPILFTCAPGGPILRHEPLQRYFTYTIAPGGSISDMVAVLNLSQTSPITVSLASADAVTPPAGAGITFLDAGIQHTIGRWIRLSVPSVTVAPRQYAIVPLTLQVPSSTPPGEYTGVINATDQQPIIVTQGRQRLLLHVTDRCGVTIRVTGTARAGLTIVRASFVTPYKEPLLSVTFRNTGTVIDHPVSTILTFTSDSRTYTVRPRFGAIVAGASTTLIWNIKNYVPPGAYKVHISVSYNADVQAGAPSRVLQASWSGNLSVAKG